MLFNGTFHPRFDLSFSPKLFETINTLLLFDMIFMYIKSLLMQQKLNTDNIIFFFFFIKCSLL